MCLLSLSLSLSLFLAQHPTDNTHHMLIVLAVFLPKGVRIVFLVDSIDTTDKIFGRSSFYLGNNNNTNKKVSVYVSYNVSRHDEMEVGACSRGKDGLAVGGNPDLRHDETGTAT